MKGQVDALAEESVGTVEQRLDAEGKARGDVRTILSAGLTGPRDTRASVSRGRGS